MATNKKDPMLSDIARGAGRTGTYSGPNIAATQPSTGSDTVYANYARGASEHTQSGATPEAVRSGEVK